MRIAQVAPLWELVPPQTYGGSELVVHLLTEELVRRGHDVTLFAPSGSITDAKLVPCCPVALRGMEETLKLDKTHNTAMAYELGMLGEVFRQAGEFDVIHNHVGFQFLPFADFVETPIVTTLHNPLRPPVVKKLFERHAHLPYIAISAYQKTLWPSLNYAGVIHHGVNLHRFTPSYTHEDKDYLVFLGRLSEEKGPLHAVRIAQALGMKLIMAGKIDRVDRVFYDREIAHLVDGEQIEYVGEINHSQKNALLRDAAATLCPIEWAEPFGLVMIESMACGTPVFALRDGSVPEVIDHGRSGYIAESVDEMIEAVRDYRRFDRREVRATAEERFSMERMTDDHLALYERLLASGNRNGTAIVGHSGGHSGGTSSGAGGMTPIASGRDVGRNRFADGGKPGARPQAAATRKPGLLTPSRVAGLGLSASKNSFPS
jgi:glycosyltransferase involved in cell wall biosynthesis